MLTIRLSRIGKKKQPSFRLLISEKHKDPWGDYLELLGNFNPRSKELNLKTERIKYWLEKGAQTSNTVHNLLLKAGVISGKKKKSVFISKAKKEKIEGKKASKEKQAEVKKAKEEIQPATEKDEKNNKVAEEEAKTPAETKEVEKTETQEKKSPE